MSRTHFNWRRLPAGPRLAVATVPDSECAAVNIHVPAGSRHENHLPQGLAHFVEHMVFKGTARRNARQLTVDIENAGCQINACTSEDQTVYEGRGDAAALDILADVLADMVWHASFPDAEIQLEHDVIGEEITMYRESPADHIGDLISAALWGGHPLGHPISGTLESISAIDRHHLAGFRDQHHLSQDLVIAVAGPFGIDECLAAFTHRLPGGFREPAGPLPFDATQALPGSISERRDTEQLQLALAWHTAGRHDESRHALRLLSLMLGETASSRLFMELREERGLCYQVSSDVTLFDETGALEIHAGLDPASREEALRIIHREIRDLAGNGPRAGELDRAKRLALTQSKLSFETTSSHAAWAGESLLDFGRIPSPDEWRQRVLAVTDQEIRAVASRVFDNRPPSMAEIQPLDA